MTKLAAPEKFDQAVDGLELVMIENGDLVEPPVTHTFLENLYIRKMFAQAGTVLTSKIHKTEHPWAMLKGRCLVQSNHDPIIEVEAGQTGITKPNTRRVFLIKEDCIWATYHVLSAGEEALRATDAKEELLLSVIEARIIEDRPLLEGKSANELFLDKLEERSLS